MPNITSYSGSWLMWYAARGMSQIVTPLAPPVPFRKVDPKYIATAVADRIEGRVQLLCVINKDGHVEQVELVRGLDPRLDQSAMEALAKWEFHPAHRSGAAVDVDVMVEIPFHLAPKVPK
jgi:periplasmic protein TonB